MITLNQAKALEPGDIVYHATKTENELNLIDLDDKNEI